jgi:hypothetical protein
MAMAFRDTARPSRDLTVRRAHASQTPDPDRDRADRRSVRGIRLRADRSPIGAGGTEKGLLLRISIQRPTLHEMSPSYLLPRSQPPRSATRDGSVQFSAVRISTEIKSNFTHIYPSVPAAEVLRQTTVLLAKGKARQGLRCQAFSEHFRAAAAACSSASPRPRASHRARHQSAMEGLVGGVSPSAAS